MDYNVKSTVMNVGGYLLYGLKSGNMLVDEFKCINYSIIFNCLVEEMIL